MKVLWEKKYSTTKSDPWGTDAKEYSYQIQFRIRLAWNKGFYWGIDTPDFSTWDKRLSVCIFRALEHMHDDSPRYYRLESRLMKLGLWKQLW
ncbi:MAG: hypothetical protein IKH57_25680 [Clostridia bacterium]|nr:hypothetical protein [Clostridia bacterium]